jgi:membrane-bound lytic murein transglycosylase C
MKKHLIALILLMIPFCVFAAGSFDDFKKEMDSFKDSDKEFTDYKDKLEKDFETYKNIVEEEFRAYKAEIEKFWDTPETSTNTVWVEYINSYRIRKVVDFDKGEIRIDVINGSLSDIKPVLTDLLTEDRAVAFQRDPVAVQTERRLREQVPSAVTAKVTDDPVIAPLFDKKKLSTEEADKLSAKLAQQAETKTVKNEKTGDSYISATISLPADRYQKAASAVKPDVAKYAEKFRIDPALVMAVIYTESRFNPLAKSHVPAYGLMQIVPKSAGADVTQFLEGAKRILAPSYLYVAENNIKTGSAFLHMLYYKYFKDVKDPQSRLFCSIAAYNTGAGNVAYAFNGKNGGKYRIQDAVPKINKMTPDQVYNYLKNNLRYEEARHYIVNVSAKIKDY